MKTVRRRILLALGLLLALAGAAEVAWHELGGGTGLVRSWRAYPVRALLPRAPGISPGTPVTIAGIPVGRVRRVDFADPDALDGGAVLELAIARDRRLRRGTWLRVTERLDAAHSVVELLPGPAAAEPLEAGATLSGDVISAAAAALPPEVLRTIDRSAVQLGEAAESLAALLRDFRGSGADGLAGGGVPAGSLGSAVRHLDGMLASLDDLLGDAKVRAELKQALQNMRVLSDSSTQAVGHIRGTFARAEQTLARSDDLVTRSETVLANIDRRTDEAAQRLNQVLDELAALLRDLRPAAGRISRGQGTLGRLIFDEQLYDALVVTLRRSAPAEPRP